MGLVAPQSNSSLALTYLPDTLSLAWKNSLSPWLGSLEVGLFDIPVLPKPCVPLSVELREFARIVLGVLICSRISCAIRSPNLTMNSASE